MPPCRKLIILWFSMFLSCAEHTVKVKPEFTGITESIYASGTIKSYGQYQAYAPVSGIIKEVFVSEGDMVKKRSPILLIGNDAQVLNRQNAALALQLADVTANQGKLNDATLAIDLAANKLRNDSLLYHRQLLLWGQNIGTKVELEQRELNYLGSRTALHAARTAYKDLKRQITINAAQSRNNLAISDKLAGDYILRSEIDGVIYELTGKIGEMVGPQTPLALLGKASQFILELQVDEHDILQVQKGMKVLVTMDSYKGQVYEAIVTKVNPLMKERSKTFLVQAEFTQGPPRLYPNVTFEANIIIQTKAKALLIPRSFMLNDSTVLKSNGEKVTIKTGMKDYQKIEVISGINPDDELKQPGP